MQRQPDQLRLIRAVSNYPSAPALAGAESTSNNPKEQSVVAEWRMKWIDGALNCGRFTNRRTWFLAASVHDNEKAPADL
ncbi:hypothetical protein [Rhodopseudomonas sp. BR0G17]|uniref:hypothetical protein n=1 Tax=Rhodopseudomonas sp. BR0G17 TaxID=2269368 RepID=UPI0013E038F8|nr:hypothetical protein [Rhodopseudomonas sp. BR0G17]